MSVLRANLSSKASSSCMSARLSGGSTRRLEADIQGGIYRALYESDDIFFEIDALGNMMPRDEIPARITHERDSSSDLSTVVTYLSSDNYETDSNGDIMPR